MAGTGLPTLLSRALMSFRAEFERDSALSLPVSANMLRVLSAAGVALPACRAGPGSPGRRSACPSAGWLPRRQLTPAWPPGVNQQLTAWRTPGGGQSRVK